jgi:hypothetical protein
MFKDFTLANYSGGDTVGDAQAQPHPLQCILPFMVLTEDTDVYPGPNLG